MAIGFNRPSRSNLEHDNLDGQVQSPRRLEVDWPKPKCCLAEGPRCPEVVGQREAAGQESARILQSSVALGAREFRI